jgi:hypothetical protein
MKEIYFYINHKTCDIKLSEKPWKREGAKWMKNWSEYKVNEINFTGCEPPEVKLILSPTIVEVPGAKND